MGFKIKHLIHWQSTLLGIILIATAVSYVILKEDTDAIIFFGVLGLGIALLFLPDTLIRGLRNLVRKNQNKEL